MPRKNYKLRLSDQESSLDFFLLLYSELPTKSQMILSKDLLDATPYEYMKINALIKILTLVKPMYRTLTNEIKIPKQKCVLNVPD